MNVPVKRGDLLKEQKAMYSKNSYTTIFPAYGLNLVEKPANLQFETLPKVPLKFTISKDKLKKHYKTEYKRNLEPTPSEVGRYQMIHHSGNLQKMHAE